jgi:hypothetical protein
MAEEFEDRDLRGAVFWDVDLSGAHFRDVNLTDVTITHARLANVDIDALIDRLVVNGVDVTDYVNERDRWYPLRAMLRTPDPDGMRTAWTSLELEWAPTIERASRLTEEQLHRSVDGEWSFVDTLRHLVFAMDKWFTVPILGDERFHPLGLPNTGSTDFGWPGLDRSADPSFDDVLAVRTRCSARFRDFLETVTAADLLREVDVLENGPRRVDECVQVVFEEEFQHHRYAVRDLAAIE